MAFYDIIIVGGGLAGLTLATEMAGAGYKACLLEKKEYPYHKVCGEYISNEVLAYLQRLGLDPFALGAVAINRLRISSPSGKNFHSNLNLGGFGISRYVLDENFSKLAASKGAELFTKQTVTSIDFIENEFQVGTREGLQLTAPLVIGSWGKREVLDKSLDREFITKKTGYMGVKYHIRIDRKIGEIGLDNFDGGYCGISGVEGGAHNLCYLRKRNKIGQQESIQEYEEEVLFKNPQLKSIFKNADFLFPAPVVINEICFSPKTLIENHILMCGDTAGLITPLCGNGMSMAIGAAALLASLIKGKKTIINGQITIDDRMALESAYTSAWSKQFKSRLFWGRNFQKLFGNPKVTSLALEAVHAVPWLQQKLVRATHGDLVDS